MQEDRHVLIDTVGENQVTLKAVWDFLKRRPAKMETNLQMATALQIKAMGNGCREPAGDVHHHEELSEERSARQKHLRESRILKTKIRQVKANIVHDPMNGNA